MRTLLPYAPLPDKYVLDKYFLSITLIVTVAYQLLFFLVAWLKKFDKVTDFAGGSNFIILSLLTLGLSSFYHGRNVVASVFVAVYGARLSGFLLFRILKTGKDERFNDMREDFWKFLGFWCFQILWVWIACLPVTLLNSPQMTRYQNVPGFGSATDILGIVVWSIGMFFEAVSDIQKYRFRAANRDRILFMKTGLFKYSRHPNYFGDILMQFGVWIMTITPAMNGSGVLWVGILGPVFVTFLLMFVSGVPLSERPVARRRYLNHEDYEGYTAYLKRTSILIPFPPRLYEGLPQWLKSTVFLEFPMYRFDPEKLNAGEEATHRSEGAAA